MTKQILVIDDNAAARMAIEAILTSCGYGVTCAADGDEGVQLFRGLRPDLVITDLIMPHKEGFETILALRRERQALKIIAMSGGGLVPGTNFLSVAKEFGADHIIAKPFDAEELIAVVELALSP